MRTNDERKTNVFIEEETKPKKKKKRHVRTFLFVRIYRERKEEEKKPMANMNNFL